MNVVILHYQTIKQVTIMATNNNTDKNVKQIISAIKKALKQDCNVPQVKIEVENTSLNGYTCDIFIGEQEWRELGGSTMTALKNAIKEIKGISVVEDKDIYFGRCMWDSSPSIAKFPTLICKFGKPCKEFNQLAKLVLKKYGINLGIKDLYSVHLFGKCGRYSESGSRNYNIAYNSATCQRYIDYIKSFGRKKTTCKIVADDDMEDLEHSRIALTECYGYRTMRLRIERA